jgi:hypothetical protein
MWHFEYMRSDPDLQEALAYTFGCDYSALGVVRVSTGWDEPFRMEIWPDFQFPFGPVYNSGFELVYIDDEWYLTGKGWFFLD